MLPSGWRALGERKEVELKTSISFLLPGRNREARPVAEAASSVGFSAHSLLLRASAFLQVNVGLSCLPCFLVPAAASFRAMPRRYLHEYFPLDFRPPFVNSELP